MIQAAKIIGTLKKWNGKFMIDSIIKFNKEDLKLLKDITLPKPHPLTNKPLQAGLDGDILGIVNELSRVLPQLNDFINQFDNQVITNNINVITDSSGNLSFQVPDTITEAKSKLITARMNLLDNLIHNHLDKTEGLIHKGICIEERIIDKDPEYETKLTTHISDFRKLRSSYRHL